MLYRTIFFVIGASCIGAIPVKRDEPDSPSCAVNVSLPCDFTVCQGSQTQCHKTYLAERKVVLKRITRLRHKIKDIIKTQGRLHYQSTPRSDLPRLFPELIKGERLEKGFKPIKRVLEAIYIYTVQLLEKENSNTFQNDSKKRLLRLVIHILCRVYRNIGLKQKMEIESICVNPNAFYIQWTFRVFENLLAKISTHKIRGKRRCKPQKRT